MSITRRYHEPSAAPKRTTVDEVAPTGRRSDVAHDSAALKLGVGNDREGI